MPDKNTHERISKLLKLALISDKDGEAVAALKHLRQTLETAQLDIYDFADYASAYKTTEPPWDIEEPKPKPKPKTETKPPPSVDWRTKVTFIIINTDSKGSLSDTENKFIKNLQDWKRPLSEKQENWLNSIYYRVQEKVRAKR